MPKCAHKGHQITPYKYKREGRGPIKMELLMGWNPVHRRLEICDVGLVEKRIYRGRPEAGKSKKVHKVQ